MKRSIEIYVLGIFEARVEGRKVEHFYSRKVKAMLAYLASRSGEHIQREELCALLWPRFISGSARTNLRRALSELKKSLAPSDLLQSNRQEVWLARESDAWDLSCDILDAAQGALATGARGQGREDLSPVGSGAFCCDLNLKDLPRLDAWRRDMNIAFQQLLQERRQKATAQLEAPRPGNLPIPPTPLIGRKYEQSWIEANLGSGQHRLITITGPGGMGKTRLALDMAHRLKNNFEDGVWWIHVAGLSLPHTPNGPDAATYAERHLATLLRQVLGLAVQYPDPANELAKQLSSHSILLVIDELDELATPPLVEGTARFFSRLMATAPGVCVLVTSRARLCIEAETHLALGGLNLSADDSHQADPRRLHHSPGVQLFVDTANRATPQFRLSEQAMPDITAICGRVGGHPLSIRMAASFADRLSPREILVELEGSLSALSSDLRDTPHRQRCLGRLMDQAWLKMDTLGQIAAVAWSTFEASFDIDAACALFATPKARATVDGLLERLLNRSIINTASRGRYTMHKATRALLRELTRDRRYQGILAERQVSPEHLRERYQRYVLHEVAIHWPTLLTGDRNKSRRLRHLVADAVAAWQGALADERLELLAEAALGFSFLLSHSEAGSPEVVLLQSTIETLEARRPQEETGELITTCSVAAATLCIAHGNHEPARIYLERAAGQSPSPQLRRLIDYHLGVIALRQGQIYEARQRLQACTTEPSQETIVDAWARANAYNALSALEHKSDANRPLIRESLEEARTTCATWALKITEAYTLINLAGLSYLDGDFPTTARIAAESIDLLQQLGDNRPLSNSQIMLGVAHQRLGAFAQAAEVLKEAINNGRRLGQPDAEAMALLNLSVNHRAVGDMAAAADGAQRALTLAQRCGEAWLQGVACARLGDALLRRKPKRAALLYERAIAFAEPVGYWPAICLAARGQIELALKQGEALGSDEACSTLLAIAREHRGLRLLDAVEILWTLYEGLLASDSPAAMWALAEAHAVLTAHAAHIQESTTRERFLVQVPWNRAVEETYSSLSVPYHDRDGSVMNGVDRLLSTP